MEQPKSPTTEKEWLAGLDKVPSNKALIDSGQFTPGEIAAGRHYSKWSLPPMGGANYAPGQMAGINFPTWNVTPGNVEYAPSEKLTFARIAYPQLANNREVHGAEKRQIDKVGSGLPGFGSFGNSGSLFGQQVGQGGQGATHPGVNLGRDFVPNLEAQMRRGGRTSIGRQMHAARRRALMHARMMRLGGRLLGYR